MARPAQVLVRNRPLDLDRLLPVLPDPELRLPRDDANLADALNRVSELLTVRSGRYAQREVYLLTDLQKATWPLGSCTSSVAETVPT